ncbi:MAG TPA: site-2 protease family protein [Blastocatellia bacterium]|nr:site-2 protease family protein [Blastocatellia bacterium]
MLFRHFQLARVFGIPLIIDYSWPPMAFLHVWLLAEFWFPARIGHTWPLWQNLLLGAVVTVLFFSSVLIHELAHSLVARLEGIKILDIQLHIFGGWARMAGEPPTAMAEFRVAIAGPVSSFLLGLFFVGWMLLMQAIVSYSNLTLGMFEACRYLAFANVFLAVFNLLPGLPLDGGRALRALLWHRRKDILSATRTAKRMGVGIAYILIGYSVLTVITGVFRGTLWKDFLVAIWLLIIGVFLKTAAESDYRHRERQRAHEEARQNRPQQWDLSGTVGAVMKTPVVSVTPELKVNEFIDRILSAHRDTNFPVARDGRLHGILSLARLRQVPSDEWEQLNVSEIMEPINDELFVTVRAPIEQARTKLQANQLGYLAVIDPDGFLVGSLHENDLRHAA